jgi:B12-binding domain/radical SAM domain protein
VYVPSSDLVLVHPPSVFDFRRRRAATGPISDVVPSTPVFEMYPLGFLSIANHLAHRGMRVRIANLALRMLVSKRFDPRTYLKKLRARAFGIDLHWAVHAHGALEVARLLKELHPHTPIIFGGLSSSYFYDELIRFPFVDYVLRGDSVEEPLARLMEAIRERRDPDDVPNLVWKRSDEIESNDITWVPEDLDYQPMDYGEVIRCALRHMDPVGHLPYLAWPREGSTALLPFRGCPRDCTICGGGRTAYKRFLGRTRVGMRSPEKLAADVGRIASLLRGPIVILGDLRMGGADYAERFFDAAAHYRVSNSVMLELHTPSDREFLERGRRAFRHFNVQLSPESRCEDIRTAFGRSYANDSLDTFLGHASEICDRVDVFFMVGLPRQTPQAVDDTTSYCEELLKAQSRGGNVHPHMAPLAPFLDPGSRAFEDPERYGYTVRYRTLKDLASALCAENWADTLNYETKWMSRSEIAASVYRSALRLSRQKHTLGMLSKRHLTRIEQNIARAEGGTSGQMGAPGWEGETVAKKELRWRASVLPVRPLAALRAAVGALRAPIRVGAKYR